MSLGGKSKLRLIETCFRAQRMRGNGCECHTGEKEIALAGKFFALNDGAAKKREESSDYSLLKSYFSERAYQLFIPIKI